MKSVLDRIGAALLLVVLSPVLLAAALAVLASGDEVDSGVLFRQRRIGHLGREFVLLKFRTMTGDPEVDGEADAGWAAAILGAPWPPPTPDRSTPVGRFLRRFRIDELPQLVNVLRGEMSLVGPRPERSTYSAQFEEAVPGYGTRTRVKPGITGLAQVEGLVGPTSISSRTALDNLYIERWSLWLDLTILVRTLPAVLLGRMQTEPSLEPDIGPAALLVLGEVDDAAAM
ncbi:MAG: exopolysaccharide biosynthesis polyprenyl glycosylphosphotransferase [Acidimicrobiales bacterium]|nr:exopolysaccharide biosynthesis polyprenyl glycosylphosphotransferase [Acidimicrobiales bacterium]